MLVVLAHESDSSAAALVERWRDRDARLMTVRDLSSRGWRQPFGASGAARAVVDGHVVPIDDIAAVLPRLPYIGVQSLQHVRDDDREYVATEMSAFLTAWLSRLPCKVVPRPRPPSIATIGWRPEQWLRAAALLGIPIAPMQRRVTPEQGIQRVTPPAGATVTIAGAHALGPAEPVLRSHARRLAAAAGADLLAVHFSGADESAAIVGADEWPDLLVPEVADALLATLTGPDA